ncbi:MAG TPA: tetratricopeptide repeat protein [Stellaceae bacterium]|nr:tetratricopeptide repeat protein [Stellaceae bacterium]
MTASLASAFEHFRAERLAEAETEAKAALAAERHAHAGWHLLAVIAHRTGELEAAEMALRKALALAPESAVYHADLGAVLAARRQPEKAVREFKAAIGADPGYLPGYFRLAELEAERDRDWDAETALRQAVAARPDATDTHFRLGVYLQERVRPAQAARAFAQAFSLDPRNAEAANRLANSLDLLGRSGEAVPALEAVLRAHPEDQVSLVNLATVLIKAGRFDEAEPLVRHARAAYPALAVAQDLETALRQRREAALSDAGPTI